MNTFLITARACDRALAAARWQQRPGTATLGGFGDPGFRDRCHVISILHLPELRLLRMTGMQLVQRGFLRVHNVSNHVQVPSSSCQPTWESGNTHSSCTTGWDGPDVRCAVRKWAEMTCLRSTSVQRLVQQGGTAYSVCCAVRNWADKARLEWRLALFRAAGAVVQLQAALQRNLQRGLAVLGVAPPAAAVPIDSRQHIAASPALS